MNNTTESSKQLQNDSPSVAKVGRRRFIHGAGIAVPVIMTIRSPSAMATGAQCLAPSASASIALLHSRKDRKQLTCMGRTPGFWGNAAKRDHPNHTYWTTIFGSDPASPPAPADSITSINFEAIFSGGFPGKKLHEVIWLNGAGDPDQLGAHLAAAYLNFKIGWVPSAIDNKVLSLSDLQEMWAGRGGTYSPTAGVTWGSAQIVTYLKTTMPL